MSLDRAGTDCSGDSFADADLRAADFRKAVLDEADLSGADARGAMFFRADMFEAKLVRAHLSGCDFRHAMLVRADLSGADATDADFTDATIAGARFTDSTILAGAKGFGIDDSDHIVVNGKTLEGSAAIEWLLARSAPARSRHP